jgi:phage-related protein
MSWSVETLNATVDTEILALAAEFQGKLIRMIDAVKVLGPMGLPRDWSKSLGDGLWELRLQGRDGIARAIYVTATGRRVVIVRVFVKKTQKTPGHELELARRRAKEVR